MPDLDDTVALEGGEQTSAPVVAPQVEEAPPNAREAVRRAFDKAKVEAEERDTARTEERAARADRLNVNKEPPAEGENPDKPTVDRTRDPKGKFVKAGATEPAPVVETPAQEAPEAVETPKVEAAPVATGPLKPPPGWNAAARAVFATLPPEVKEAVARREAEVAAGFQAKESTLQKYKGLETYTPMIEGSGLTHTEFTKRAVEWEQSLKTNPVGTLMHVAKLGGVDIIQLARQIYQQQQGGQGQQQGQQPQARPQAQPAPDVNAIVEAKLAEREQKVRAHAAETTIAQFMSDPKNVHAEALTDQMAYFISSGQADTLEKAYDMACYASPEIRATLLRQASANPGSVSDTERARLRASEARKAAKATVGAPSGIPVPAKDTRDPKATIRDDVRRAYEMARAQT